MNRSLRWLPILLLSAVFLYAGGSKVTNPVRFATDIGNYHLVSWPIAVAMAFYLPWIEIVCALALFFRPARGSAAVLLAAMLFLFIGAIASAKMRGIDLTCGCFGHAAQNLSFVHHLGLNSVLAAAAVFLCYQETSTTGR